MLSFLRRHHFLVFFVLLTNIMGISIGMAKVSTTLLALQLGADASLQGLIASAQSIGVVIMSIPIGFMMDRAGPGRLFIVGSLLVGAIYLLLPLMTTPWAVLFATAMVSLFMPMRFVSLNAVFMAELETLGESKAGWYRGSHMTGMFLIGPVLAAIAVEALGFVGTFWSIVALFAVSILLSPTVFRHYQRRTIPPAAAAPAYKITARLALLFRDEELRRVGLIEFCAQSINAFYIFFILIIAINQLHMAPLPASHLIGINGGAYIFALLFLGKTVQRVGHELGYLLSFSAALLALLMLGLGQQLLWLMVGGALLGLCLGTLQIITLTRFARLSTRLGRGEVSGVSSLMGPSGSFFGSLIGGFIGQHFGLQPVFLFFILPVVLMVAWTASQWRQQQLTLATLPSTEEECHS